MNNNDEESIGQKIRNLRKSSKTTLETLAKRTGFTKGYLSKIERGLQIPPIATLSRLAEALNVEVANFFEKKQHDLKYCIIRKNERKPIVQDGNIFGYRYESLAYTKHDKFMSPFLITLIPHATDKTVFKHDGQEMMFVLQGSVEFWYDNERVVLEEGDCVYLDSEVSHRAQCIGDIESKVLTVIYLPRTNIQ